MVEKNNPKPESPSGQSARSKSAQGADAIPSSHLFFEEEPRMSLVIEREETFFAASRSAAEDLRVRIEKVTGKTPVPVFDPHTDDAMEARAFHILSSGGVQPAAMMRPPELNRFLEIPVDDPKTVRELVGEVRKSLEGEIRDCLPVPPATPAIAPLSRIPAARAGRSPDFRYRQLYMADAPAGVNAVRSWQLPGGAGQDVTVIDLEGGWQLSHENLASVRFNLWGGENQASPGWREHGTAVVGILAGSPDAFGTTGICPAARVGMYSVFEDGRTGRQRVANSILRAGQMLSAGDVLLVELQRPGPRTNYESDPDQKGYLPVAYWPDIRMAIRTVTGLGVTVVAVGGNGGENLDDEMFGKRLDPATNDSGAIHVGAGAPPGGQFGPARTRLDFSNYGSCIDAQGWGQSITTSGYGDLWGGPGTDVSYTGTFMGTSSAAPIVCGVIACLQGRHKAVHGVPMAPAAVRQVLRTFGWRPEDTDGDATPIGLQPDLMALYHVLGLA